ncbi:putative protein phosphatase 2C [Hordeum vulgare]|nr:putative protein phosphatase 2C [Hordeum vulgare]
MEEAENLICVTTTAVASGRMGGGGGAVPAMRRSLSHGGRRIHDFTHALLARTDRFQGHPDLGSPDAAAAVAACGGDSNGLQWAQGKAGEDRVHVVVSKERGWVFVGIYDGFNGLDATDFLVSNLYAAVHRELRGLLWEQSQEDQPGSAPEGPEASRRFPSLSGRFPPPAEAVQAVFLRETDRRVISVRKSIYT